MHSPSERERETGSDIFAFLLFPTYYNDVPGWDTIYEKDLLLLHFLSRSSLKSSGCLSYYTYPCIVLYRISLFTVYIIRTIQRWISSWSFLS